ncbi:MAG TPA: PQQ-binding-like beta-propeller repeat protein, partial [Blastocatellia bacterium]|nr:PQQ-binding-like beta-propeller repeat protein [Blastocatellia bacterium]
MNMNFALPFKRQTKIAIVALLFCCALFVPAHQAQKKQPSAKKPAGNIDDKKLRQADSHPGEWMTHGRTYSEARYSPLKRIDSSNIQRLGLAWSFDTQTNRGLEATPLVVDGVMYTTGSWSVVYALDAKTGEQLWKYDPQIARSYGARACCDVVNRGVAVYKGKVYVGALDGRLIALDAGDGKVVWQVMTVDQNQPYTITGAPRVVKGKVIIGNGGAEYGVRGYVSAYDAET